MYVTGPSETRQMVTCLLWAQGKRRNGYMYALGPGKKRRNGYMCAWGPGENGEMVTCMLWDPEKTEKGLHVCYGVR